MFEDTTTDWSSPAGRHIRADLRLKSCSYSRCFYVVVPCSHADGLATCEPELYSRINSLIRERGDIVLNDSTGEGIRADMIDQLDNSLWEIDFNERINELEGASAEMRIVDAHTVCSNGGDCELLVTTTPSRLRWLAEEMDRGGIKPEREVLSLAHFQDVTEPLEAGFDDAQHFKNSVLRVHRGFHDGLPYFPRILRSMVRSLCELGVKPATPTEPRGMMGLPKQTTATTTEPAV